MKSNFTPLIAGCLALSIYAGTAIAGDQHKMVIELKTNDFVVAETDISDLAIGEAKTILTDSGKTIDILRTEDGADIYVDGELMDMPTMEGAHNSHADVEFECITDSGDADDSDCDHDMMFISDDDFDVESIGEDGVGHKVFIKRIHHECESEQEGECEDERVWVSDGGDLEFADLHEAGEGTHKVVRIHKSHDGDENIQATAEKVIIIKKKSEEEL